MTKSPALYGLLEMEKMLRLYQLLLVLHSTRNMPESLLELLVKLNIFRTKRMEKKCVVESLPLRLRPLQDRGLVSQEGLHKRHQDLDLVRQSSDSLGW